MYLILEDGTVMQGYGFGAAGEAMGELVFTTSMVGYMETITDPSYAGQIVVQTFPSIGNYGVMASDVESDSPALNAYIVREWCQEPSNFRCEGVLDTFLKEKGVVGLCGIDTRALTRRLRDCGAMNAMITADPTVTEERLAALRAYKVEHAVAKVAPREKTVSTSEQADKRVVLWNFGAQASAVRNLVKYGCEVVSMPWSATAEEILAENPTGVLVSDGPGDPAELVEASAELAKVMATDLPVLGIGLGHQLMAIAKGGRTVKMPFGHRGGNQPVVFTESGHVYITSQNHGYTVVGDSLPTGAKINFVNANDGTCEGIEYAGGRQFSVQFMPDAFGGKLDTTFVYECFLALL